MEKHLKKVLGVESVIAFPKSTNSANSEIRIKESIENQIEIFQYRSRQDLENFIKKENITHNYIYSDGIPSNVAYTSSRDETPIIENTIHITRPVFKNFQPHGDFYLYASEWLFRSIENKLGKHKEFDYIERPTTISYIPFMVEPEIGDRIAFRELLKIPPSSKVLGRIGGFDQFNDKAAHKAIFRILEKERDLFVILVNTNSIGIHPRLVYVPYVSRAQIWDFYAACDVLLNGRKMGESFGFSIVEPLSAGKPVIGPGILRNPFMDKHHIDLLSPLNLTYQNSFELFHKLRKQISDPIDSETLKLAVKNFTPELVMQKFQEIVFNNQKRP